MHTIEITNSQGIPFTVRVVRKGDRYGLEDRILHDEDDPLIEFYDLRHTGRGFTPMGQFVTRYYARTLAGITASGLALDCGIPSWFVDGDGLQRVIGIAQHVTTNPTLDTLEF